MILRTGTGSKEKRGHLKYYRKNKNTLLTSKKFHMVIINLRDIRKNSRTRIRKMAPDKHQP
jgi:hypothetical protein